MSRDAKEHGDEADISATYLTSAPKARRVEALPSRHPFLPGQPGKCRTANQGGVFGMEPPADFVQRLLIRGAQCHADLLPQSRWGNGTCPPYPATASAKHPHPAGRLPPKDPEEPPRVSLRAGRPITPGRRASLVGAVLDLPEVQTSARMEAEALLGRLNSSSAGSAVLYRKG
jgi:hypothetical protein